MTIKSFLIRPRRNPMSLIPYLIILYHRQKIMQRNLLKAEEIIKNIENQKQVLYNRSNSITGGIYDGRKSINQRTGSGIASGNMESKIENTRQVGK